MTLAETAEILRGMSKSQQQHKWIWVIFMSEKWYSLQPEMSEWVNADNLFKKREILQATFIYRKYSKVR